MLDQAYPAPLYTRIKRDIEAPLYVQIEKKNFQIYKFILPRSEGIPMPGPA
jgi:hypothetical protein